MYRIYITCLLLLFKSLQIVDSCRVRFILPDYNNDCRNCNRTHYGLGLECDYRCAKQIEEPDIFHKVYSPYFMAEHILLFPAPKDDYCDADYQTADNTVTDVIIYDINDYDVPNYENGDNGEYYISLSL